MKKINIIIISVILLLGLGIGIYTISTKSPEDNRVVIYAGAEDIVIESLQRELNKKFPKYDIVVEYMSSSNMATKINAEKTETIIDIAYDLEYGSIGLLSDYLEDLEYDESKYMDDFITENKKYVPVGVSTMAIIYSPSRLAKKGLAIPKNYEDLLKPEYKNLIAMPNPGTTGSGYIFLKSLVNNMGEEKAYKYFDKLNNNLLEFTSSGMTPVSMLERKEIEIAMGLTSQAARSITDGHDFEIVWFDEGSPYTFYVMSVIKGRMQRKAVRDVYEYIENTLNAKVNKECFIESAYKVSDYKIPNYPDKVPYSNMSNYTFEEKERLLNKWKY